MLSGKTRNSHLRLNEPDKSNNHPQSTISAKQSPEESSEQNQVDVVLYRHGILDSLHRPGGDHAQLHLRLPGQGGGQEHVLQRRQHHQLLRLEFIYFQCCYNLSLFYAAVRPVI